MGGPPGGGPPFPFRIGKGSILLVLSNVLLWVLVLLNILLSWGIIRRMREFDRRIASVATAGLPMMSGLEPGTAAPDFSVGTPAGDTVTRAQLLQGETVLAFFSPTCDACVEHLPQVRRYATDTRPADTRLVAVVDGEPAEGRTFIENLEGVASVTFADPAANPIVRDYQVGAFPSYYVIAADGRVRALHHRVEELPTR